MYCRFYGLRERPFNVTADPAFFYSSKKHKEALSHLFYGVSQRKGLIVLTGEIGTGKTTLCRFFINQLAKNIKTAFVLNPQYSENQLLEVIVNDFGIRAKKSSRLSLVSELNKFLLHESSAGNNVVLIIDESQNLKPKMLEHVRLLSNLETEKDKLLQIILVGQPELNDRLNLYNLRQLKQRVMVMFHISPLDEDEVRSYIGHRLNIAGSNNRPEFTEEAVRMVCEFSAGIPRVINTLCDRALLAGFVSETYTIDSNIIKKCSEELAGLPTGERQDNPLACNT